MAFCIWLSLRKRLSRSLNVDQWEIKKSCGWKKFDCRIHALVKNNIIIIKESSPSSSWKHLSSYHALLLSSYPYSSLNNAGPTYPKDNLFCSFAFYNFYFIFFSAYDSLYFTLPIFCKMLRFFFFCTLLLLLTWVCFDLTNHLITFTPNTNIGSNLIVL